MFLQKLEIILARFMFKYYKASPVSRHPPEPQATRLRRSSAQFMMLKSSRLTELGEQRGRQAALTPLVTQQSAMYGQLVIIIRSNLGPHQRTSQMWTGDLLAQVELHYKSHFRTVVFRVVSQESFSLNKGLTVQ